MHMNMYMSMDITTWVNLCPWRYKLQWAAPESQGFLQCVVLAESFVTAQIQDVFLCLLPFIHICKNTSLSLSLSLSLLSPCLTSSFLHLHLMLHKISPKFLTCTPLVHPTVLLMPPVHLQQSISNSRNYSLHLRVSEPSRSRPMWMSLWFFE